MKLELSQLPPRNEVKKDPQKGIFNNGSDNAYPQRIERIINSSVTAKTSVEMLRKFIIGDGFEDTALNSIVVYSDFMGKTTLYKLLSQIADPISKHKGAFLEIQWTGNAQISAVKHLPYRYGRFGKADSLGYSGKVHVCDEWEGSKIGYKPKNVKVLDVYNPIKEVVLDQFKQENWTGQVAFMRLDDEYVYPLSFIDPVIEDADTESQISSFKNGELRTGFFAKYILFHTEYTDKADEDAFKSVLKKFQGGEHQGSILLADAQFDSEGKFIASSTFDLKKIEQNIDDKIFESYEQSVANNIRKAVCAIPKILIDSSDNTMFGTSGAAFTEAFNFFNTQTSDIRSAISQWLKDIFSHSDNEVLRNANFNIKQKSYGTVDVSGPAANQTAGQK